MVGACHGGWCFGLVSERRVRGDGKKRLLHSRVVVVGGGKEGVDAF